MAIRAPHASLWITCPTISSSIALLVDSEDLLTEEILEKGPNIPAASHTADGVSQPAP